MATVLFSCLTDGFQSGEICQMLLIGVDTHLLNPKSSLILEPPH